MTQTNKWKDITQDIHSYTSKISKGLVDISDSMNSEHMALPDICPKDMYILSHGLQSCMQGLSAQINEWSVQIKGLSQTFEDMIEMLERKKEECEVFRDNVLVV